LTNINNRAYRSLHKFSLNNANNLADQTTTPTPTQGTPIKKFWTPQLIVPPAAQNDVTKTTDDTVTLQTTNNSNSLYQRPAYNGPTIETKPRDRSSALSALHKEHPNASSDELQELLKRRLKANFLDFS
jgi:hypothetical protein